MGRHFLSCDTSHVIVWETTLDRMGNEIYLCEKPPVIIWETTLNCRKNTRNRMGKHF